MSCAVFGFEDCEGPAAALARSLALPFHRIAVRNFPDGESLVRIPASAETALLYRSLDNPNGKLIELLLAASAARGCGASRVILIVPYLAYMRQDAAFNVGEAVSQRVIGGLLAGSCDALLTVDPHLHRVHSLAEIMPGIEAVSVSAAPVIADALADWCNPLLVGPDEESLQWVKAVADRVGATCLLGRKRRRGDRQVEVTVDGIERAAGRHVVLVDDLIASGTTMKVLAGLLSKAGAAQIDAVATHCLAGTDDLGGLKRAGVSSIRATATTAGPAATLPVAALLAAEIVKRGWLACGGGK